MARSGLFAAMFGRLRLFWRLLRDRRTPTWAKVSLLGFALVYALSPFDLVPDWLPPIGLIDDVVVVPLVLWLLTRLAPSGARREHRRELGLLPEPDDAPRR